MSYLFASSDGHLLQFPIAELGICANGQTCRVTEKANSGLRDNETQLHKKQYAHPSCILKDPK